MADQIFLLPDAVVNQIAAGEVIQRPASVVKELLDNAIDAQASQIKLIVQDAGKSLIQVNDNGVGMSATDARMAFERHATSKIRSADDLFHIQTMGFRGEALASIASVAQVELRTRRSEDIVGTKIFAADSKIKSQEPFAANQGTQIAVQHLFYNIPARRKFLKTDSIEAKHMYDEFVRQALSHPEISFSYFLQENEIFQLPASSLKQRLINIFGKKYNEDILTLDEQTEVMHISGFVGTPTLAKKSRGDQLIFVNRRFIKNLYLQHAIHSAYEEIIPPGMFPFYVLFLDIDPQYIDINVHPTKHEIKFEDERLIYNFLKVSVRHALAKFTLAPQLDFENSQPGIEQLLASTGKASQPGSLHKINQQAPSLIPNFSQQLNWAQMAELRQRAVDIPQEFSSGISEGGLHKPQTTDYTFFQLHNAYIVVESANGLVIIDQQIAHERILYEQYKKIIQHKKSHSIKLLFPHTIHLGSQDANILKVLMPQLQGLGFELEEFGGDSFIIHAFPEIYSLHSLEVDVIQKIIDQYQMNLEFELNVEENLARSAAVSSALKKGRQLQKEEIELLIHKLFECEMPYAGPSGRKCYLSISLEEISSKLK
ncbi:MAG: DNA mismatch repair endonuclease MutL [Saprospiraceae bacterium]|nr:DNA mismatch repair endonuclease MutL [Saprospiraceae bacterium]MBK7795847.1 DNA mismatch repair endonuclease MutL [Saprospiraceae bacterium]